MERATHDRVRLAVIAAVALLVAACGGGPGEQILDEEPTFGPLVQEQALWDATGAAAISTVWDASLLGDTAVINGDEGDGYRLAVVDAATGKPHWSINERAPLPGRSDAILFRPTTAEPFLVTGPPDDFLVVVPYYRDNYEHPTGMRPRGNGEPHRAEKGVAALSGNDGSVRWLTPLVPFGGAEGTRMALLDAGENVMLVGTTDTDGTADSLHTVALSPSDGQLLWQQPGMEARFSTAGAVIAQIPSNGGGSSLGGRGTAEGSVVALDPISGSRRWDLSARFSNSDAELVAGDLVLVRASRDGNDNTLALEAATGREVANFGNPINCAGDERSLITCITPDDYALATLHLDDDTIRVSRREIRSHHLHAVWRGRVFLESFASDTPNEYPVVDRSANVLPDRIPGRLVTISDRYAIFRTTEDGAISVHAVTP